MRPDNARRNHVLFLVMGCIRRGVCLPCFAAIAAEVGFADGSGVNKALHALVKNRSLRAHRDANGKVDGYETDLGWTRLNFGTGVHRPGRRRPVKDKQAHDASTADAALRGAILDAVLAEGRNYCGVRLGMWRIVHEQSYEEAA